MHPNPCVPMVGKLVKNALQPMSVGINHTRLLDLFISIRSTKYLGGKTLSFDCNIVRRNLFAARNCIYAHAKHLEKIIHLTLQGSYYLTILAVVTKYMTKQLAELNACWDADYGKIFGYHKYEAVKSFTCSLGSLDLQNVIRIG
jgi:hypothetical protein